MYLCICICVFVFVYLCMRHLVISVLISLDQELSEYIWFVWSRTCYKGEKLRSMSRLWRRTTDGRTLESSAVFWQNPQLWIGNVPSLFRLFPEIRPLCQAKRPNNTSHLPSFCKLFSVAERQLCDGDRRDCSDGLPTSWYGNFLCQYVSNETAFKRNCFAHLNVPNIKRTSISSIP